MEESQPIVDESIKKIKKRLSKWEVKKKMQETGMIIKAPILKELGLDYEEEEQPPKDREEKDLLLKQALVKKIEAQVQLPEGEKRRGRPRKRYAICTCKGKTLDLGS